MLMGKRRKANIEHSVNERATNLGLALFDHVFSHRDRNRRIPKMMLELCNMIDPPLLPRPENRRIAG